MGKKATVCGFERVSVGELVQVAVVADEIVGFAALSEWDSFLHLLFVKLVGSNKAWAKPYWIGRGSKCNGHSN